MPMAVVSCISTMVTQMLRGPLGLFGCFSGRLFAGPNHFGYPVEEEVFQFISWDGLHLVLPVFLQSDFCVEWSARKQKVRQRTQTSNLPLMVPLIGHS